MLPDLVRNEMDYTGFLIFWRKFCGADFLNGDLNKIKFLCLTLENDARSKRASFKASKTVQSRGTPLLRSVQRQSILQGLGKSLEKVLSASFEKVMG